ncbi:Peptidyl-prolyl cis-trans isomerase FKBP4 [Blattella germanica]|nr:Peptidyl-prolyl cis-trans isomerase FKBP4 [Blattella germanica]
MSAVAQKLSEIVEPLLWEEQFGFRPGRSMLMAAGNLIADIRTRTRMTANETAAGDAQVVADTHGPNEVDITPNKDGGVLKEIIKEGRGEELPASGNRVFVHYVGTLTDGTQFDTSRDRGKAFDFNLGKGSVIKAWDIGVATMKRGEIAVLTCRSDYAYGKNGSPPTIPPDATLKFEIEMIDWTGEDLSHKKDGGILRYQIKKGDGATTPNEGAVVEVELIGKHEKEIFEQREVVFPLGEGSEYGICEGLERALEKFKKGERSRIEIKSKYAFKAEGKPEFNIPPNADIEYEVELKNFEKAKESWALDSGERLEQANFFKEKGTTYFKNGKFDLAIKMYKKVISFMEFDTGFEGEQDEQRKALLLVGHLNLALCHLRLQEHVDARDQCNKALELNPSSEKGLFRRGQANLGLGEPERAKVDFEAILKLEPSNTAAANQILVCNQKIKEQKGREKKIYANMFEKFAQRDREEPKKLLYGWWDDNDGKVISEELPVEEMEKPKPKKKLPYVPPKLKGEDSSLQTPLGDVERVITEEEPCQAPNVGDSNKAETKSGSSNSPEKEEEWRRNQPDVMKTLGEWGQDEREREMTDFERENPNILMLNSTGDEFKNM